jgi:hypothetical protein
MKYFMDASAALRAVAVEAHHRVDGHRHDLEGHEHGDELEAGDEAEHAHHREEQQRVVLPAVEPVARR